MGRAAAVTLDEFFAGCDASRELFEAVRRAVEELGPVELRVTKSQIAFRRRIAFAWAWVPGQYLRRKAAPLVLTVGLRRRAGKRSWSHIQADSPTTWSCAPPPRWTMRYAHGCGRRGRRRDRAPEQSPGARQRLHMPATAHRGKANHRIDEELVSADSLKHVLITCCRCRDVKLLREPHDPPDFTVLIDGEAFPAEVTSIVSDQQYHEYCKMLARVIRRHANSLGVLSGTYALIVSRLPCIPKPASHDGHELRDAAVAYLAATRFQSAPAETQLTHDKSGTISIAKASASGSAVEVVRWPPPLWEGETRAQLAKLIQRAVDVKTQRLQAVGVSPQKALLLFI